MARNDLISPNKRTRKTLLEQQKLPLWKKVEYAKSKIREFVQLMNGKVYISYSGGVDSEVLKHLVRSVYPGTLAVFSNTTNEFPEIIKHVKKQTNVQWVKPEMTIKEIIKKYGFPLVSKKTARKISDLRYPTTANLKTRKNVWLNDDSLFKLSYKWRFLVYEDFDTTSICCKILKHDPIHKFEKQSGLKPFVGIYAENSNMREDSAIRYGCNIYTEKTQISRPMMIWTKQDVWDYIRINNIDYCEIYDDKVLPDGTIVEGEENTGCMVCGFGYDIECKKGRDRFDRLQKRRPKLYANYMKLENNGVTFREALNKVKNAPRIRKEDAPYIPLFKEKTGFRAIDLAKFI